MVTSSATTTMVAIPTGTYSRRTRIIPTVHLLSNRLVSSTASATAISTIPTGEDRRARMIPSSLGKSAILAASTMATMLSIPTEYYLSLWKYLYRQTCKFLYTKYIERRGIQPCQIEFYLLVQFHLLILVAI